MSSPSPTRLLQHAIPLVTQYGFTRECLSRSVLSLSRPHSQPLLENAVSALFGEGNAARQTLIEAWMDNARSEMGSGQGLSVNDVLKARLIHNEPVVQHLPEAFAVLATSTNIITPLDPRPLFRHAAKIADEACYLTHDESKEKSWYARRASLAAIYTAAELHQLTSPKTASDFLDSLLKASSTVNSSMGEIELFGSYIIKSWASIIRSSGIIL